MARGRFISRDVSTSEKLAELETDFARLLWSWCIVFSDRDGRLPGTAKKVRALVVPMLDKTLDEVSVAMQDLKKQKLALIYSDEVSRSMAMQMLNFEEHQVGMRYSREAPSKYGPCPELSGLTPEETAGSRNDTTPDKVRRPPSEGEGEVEDQVQDQVEVDARGATPPASSQIEQITGRIISHPIFDDIDAAILAGAIEGERMSRGTRLHWTLPAIDEAAAKAKATLAGGDEMTTPQLAKFVVGCCRHAKAPKNDKVPQAKRQAILPPLAGPKEIRLAKEREVRRKRAAGG